MSFISSEVHARVGCLLQLRPKGLRALAVDSPCCRKNPVSVTSITVSFNLEWRIMLLQRSSLFDSNFMVPENAEMKANFFG